MLGFVVEICLSRLVCENSFANPRVCAPEYDRNLSCHSVIVHCAGLSHVKGLLVINSRLCFEATGDRRCNYEGRHLHVLEHYEGKSDYIVRRDETHQVPLRQDAKACDIT